jgi:hypothetical protein
MDRSHKKCKIRFVAPLQKLLRSEFLYILPFTKELFVGNTLCITGSFVTVLADKKNNLGENWLK